MAEVRNVTITVIFEGHALNRDEKLAGNIQSIKKLSYINGQVSYISRPAMRHYLFNTLRKAYPEEWKEASVTTQGDVIQFDITKDDIFTSAELDAFGYMYTISGENSITRKAPVGITKAVSLLTYNNDMQFNANHDLVKRALRQGIDATPDINQREENINLYKVSFTIDAKFLGEDMWIVEGFEYSGNTLIVQVRKPVEIIFDKVEEPEELEEGEGLKFKIDDGEIIIEGKTAKFSKHLVKSDEKKGTITIKGKTKTDDEANKNKQNKGKSKGKQLTLSSGSYEYDEENGLYIVKLSEEHEYNQKGKTLKLKIGLIKIFKNAKEKEQGREYIIENINKNRAWHIVFSQITKDKYKMVMTLEDYTRKERIKHILTAIKDGLVAHSSGEDNTIVPLFLIAAPVRVPSPVFHSYIHLDLSDNKPKVLGLGDCFRNSWLEDKVYVYVSERFTADLKPFEEKTYRSWEEFLRGCGLLEGEEQHASASS